jgi:hypothetical protein
VEVSPGGGLVGDSGIGGSRTQDARVEVPVVEEGGRREAHEGAPAVD